MIQLITPDRYGAFLGELAEMHRLRYRLFKERLGRDVEVSGDVEIDEFDACRPAYLPLLLDGQPAPACDTIWESSRFDVDLCSRDEKAGRSIATATYELFAGMIEFGLMRQLTDIVTVTDARMERILCRARWPLRRLGSARAIGKTLAVAGYLEVSEERCQSASNIDPALECAPGGGPIGWRELTRPAGLSENESHGQAPFAQHRIQASSGAGVHCRRDPAQPREAT